MKKNAKKTYMFIDEDGYFVSVENTCDALSILHRQLIGIEVNVFFNRLFLVLILLMSIVNVILIVYLLSRPYNLPTT